MRGMLHIGCTPYNEDCVQVDSIGAMTLELKLYRAMLLSKWPHADLRIRWESHDFGRYGEVICVFDDFNVERADEAYDIESNGPEYWGYYDGTNWVKMSKNECLAYFKGKINN